MIWLAGGNLHGLRWCDHGYRRGGGGIRGGGLRGRVIAGGRVVGGGRGGVLLDRGLVAGQ